MLLSAAASPCTIKSVQKPNVGLGGFLPQLPFKPLILNEGSTAYWFSIAEQIDQVSTFGQPAPMALKLWILLSLSP